jgi:hypothetical protein
MTYEVNITDGMVTRDGEPVGKVEDLLATLTKDEVSRDELETCYAVAVALRRCCTEHLAAEAARLADPVRWTQEDVEREAQKNLERYRFEQAVKTRSQELIDAEVAR